MFYCESDAKTAANRRLGISSYHDGRSFVQLDCNDVSKRGARVRAAVSADIDDPKMGRSAFL
eukprot:2249313-Rhodomonas_salina.1